MIFLSGLLLHPQGRQGVQQAVEVVQPVVFQFDTPLLPAPDDPHAPAQGAGQGLLGLGGSVIVSIGLCNIVALIVHQYLGHVVTIGCFLLGGVMIGVSLLLI